MRRSIPTANEQVYCSKMLVFTENNQALLSQRMKRVCDGDFARLCHIAGGRNQELLRFSPGFTHSAGSRPAVEQGVTGRSGMLAGVCVV